MFLREGPRFVQMAAKRDEIKDSRHGGWSDFFWNLIGGAMVSAMLAGVLYVLVGTVGTELLHSGNYWEMSYLKWYFISIFACYVLLPSLLAGVIGKVFGGRSRAAKR